MPFDKDNIEVRNRTDRDSKSVGKRKSSSLEGKRWTLPQLALKRRYLALEGVDFWFPLTQDEKWIKGHLRLAMLHMIMGADLSRFKTIVSERPGQLWTGIGSSWRDVCSCIGFSWAADWQSHLVVQGTDSKGNKITWINFHPKPSRCPRDVLNEVQPPLHCMNWRRKLSLIGCLNEESSDDDVEHADDEGGVGECPERKRALLEDATEASYLAIPGDVDEDCSILELSVPGEAVGPLPNPDVADPAEPPQMLNVTEIVKRGYVTHDEAKKLLQVVHLLENEFQATNSVPPGVRCIELQPGHVNAPEVQKDGAGTKDTEQLFAQKPSLTKNELLRDPYN